MSDSYIFRRTREDKYTVVPNALITDTRISWESRGLLIYLLSRPKSWTVRKTDLERQSAANDFVVSRILDELETHRYIFRERVQDEKGRFEWITYVFDEPIPQKTTDGKPPHIESKEIQKNTTTKPTKPDVLDAMLMYSKQSNGLEDYPPDVTSYLEPFIDIFKRSPAASEKGYWIKTVRESWKPIGVKPSHVKLMFAHAKEQGTAIKSPASITYAFDEIRNSNNPLAQSAKERGAVKEY